MTDTHEVRSPERTGGGRSPRRRFRRYAAPIAAGALVALVAAPTAAHAQPFGPGACSGQCFYADNSNETFFYNGLTVGDISSMEFARSTRLSSTTMTTQLQSSSNNDTDLIAYDDNYGANGMAAWWHCDLLVSGSSTLCNRGKVIVNLYYGTATSGVACQEVGHGVGLDHSTNTASCMHQPPGSASDYDAHDRGHINGYY